MKTSRCEYLSLGLIFLAGVVRFLIGLQSTHALSLDGGFRAGNLGIIGLMSKHTLELGEFPFFFWGQNWFGGLEGMLHGIAFWIFGVTPWAMRVVPLLLFVLFCMLTFLIARELFNETVALLAVCWCVVAPEYLTKLSIIPHTHYLETLTLGSLILWLSLRLTRAQSTSRKRFLYFFLGLIGGLSWWVTPLSIYYLAATVFFMLLKERFDAIRWGIILSLPGFILGVLPLLIYYAHDPLSHIFGLEHSINFSIFPLGFQQLITLAGPAIMNIPEYKVMGAWGPWAAGAFYLYVLIFCIAGTGKSFLKLFSLRPVKNDSSGILILFLLSIVMIYCTSNNAIHKYAPRYLLILFSFFPIACAYAVWQVSKRWRFMTMPFYGMFLFAQGFFIWHWAVYEVPAYDAHGKEILNLIENIKSKKIDRAYMDFAFAPSEFTFLAKESVIFAEPFQEHYYPYELALDEAFNPAFIENRPGVFTPILKMIGGSYGEEKSGTYFVDYDFKEPKRKYRQIGVEKITGEASIVTEGIGNTLDRNMATLWESGAGDVDGMWIAYDLGQEYQLGLVRLWNRGEDHGSYVFDIRVDVSQDGKEWREVIDRTQGDFYYWSGPRLYPWEWGYRWEARFGPVRARYVRIQRYGVAVTSWKAAEAYFYEDMGEREGTGIEGERDILNRIKQLGLENIYADRWMSAKVREFSGGEIETVMPFSLAKQRDFCRLKTRKVHWGRKVGFILEDADADQFEKMIKREGIELEREKYKRWELFYFSHWAEKEEALEKNESWWWMGLGVVEVDSKSESRYLEGVGEIKEKEGDSEEGEKYYERALKEYEYNQRARERLVEVLRKEAKETEAGEEEKVLKDETQPKVRREIEFERGIKFLGYTIEEDNLLAGQESGVKYYWELKGNDPEKIKDVAVFVHVEGNGRLFQGDYRFLPGVNAMGPILEEEIISQSETLKVPAEIPSGEYTIRLGLVDEKSRKRLKIDRTDLECKDGRVLIGSLQVQESHHDSVS